jgi:hypothetical protein
MLSIILAVYFISKTLRDLDKNLQETAKEMALKLKPSPLPVQCTFAAFREDLLSVVRKFTDLFVSPSRKNRKIKRLPVISVFAAWLAYVDRERFWQRIIRSLICTVAMLWIVFGILIPNGGMPFFAYRSDLAYDNPSYGLAMAR